MVNNFLINSLLSNNLYLGYTKNFRHASMLFDIRAVAYNNIELHNINHTMSYLRKTLFHFESVWSRYGNSWIVLSKLTSINRFAENFIKQHEQQFSVSNKIPILTLWKKNWTSGLLTNKIAFSLAGDFKFFPVFVFYLNYTANKSRFNEALNLGILQAGIADTNSSFSVYQYGINANEKSRSSYLFILRLILTFSTKYFNKTQKDFLL